MTCAAGVLGTAYLGCLGTTAADVTEAGGGGAAGEACLHCARCCDHACAAWPSDPTDIQLLQALQRTRSPSYLRMSGSAATKGGAGSFALQVGTRSRGKLSTMVTSDGIDGIPFAREAALAVSIPRDRTVRRVGAEADPLVTGCTADAVRLELGNIWV